MEKEPKSRLLIRFSDCDPFGHLNNARYIDYFLNAREDHLKQHYQLSLYELGRQGIGWVVAEHKLAYFRPAMSGEEVVIKTVMLGFSDQHIMVEMSMWDAAEEVCKAMAWTLFVPVNIGSGRRSSHAQHFMELFGQVSINLPATFSADGFEQRKGYYKKHNYGVLRPQA